MAQPYDANGNLTGDGAWAYVYDAENRLLSANRSGISATYQYDPLGRRAGRTVGSVTNAWLTDGDDEIAEYDGAGALLRRFVQGPMIDQPIAQVEANGTRRYLMQDRMGSIVGATSDVGVLAEGPYAYDPYGLPDTTSGVPYRYTGRRLDAETGLYYYRARYYSPTLGRFLQTDPVGYADNLNMYGYVGNDPMNRTDPTGECDVVCRRAISVAATRAGGRYVTSAIVSQVDSPLPGPADAVAAVGAVVTTGALIWDIGSAVLNNDADAPPDLTDEKGCQHITEGDERGGGHRAGTNRPGKSEFPADWTDDQIVGEVSDVATAPDSDRTQQGGRTVSEGTRNGVRIRTVDDGRRIVTGYPTNRPRNPREPN